MPLEAQNSHISASSASAVWVKPARRAFRTALKVRASRSGCVRSRVAKLCSGKDAVLMLDYCPQSVKPG